MTAVVGFFRKRQIPPPSVHATQAQQAGKLDIGEGDVMLYDAGDYVVKVEDTSLKFVVSKEDFERDYYRLIDHRYDETDDSDLIDVDEKFNSPVFEKGGMTGDIENLPGVETLIKEREHRSSLPAPLKFNINGACIDKLLSPEPIRHHPPIHPTTELFVDKRSLWRKLGDVIREDIIISLGGRP